MDEKKSVNFTVIPADETAPRTYSNFCAIQHSPFDFTLTFCEMMPITETQFVPGQDHQFIKAPVKTRVVVPVQIIPGLVAALQENYRMYQESYGPTKGPMNLKPTRLSSRTGAILDRLEKIYPDADCELTYRDAFELLIATILSAQCTDKRVNAVTPQLFARYPTAKDLAAAKLPEVEEIIRSTGFFRAKAKSITSCAQSLVANHRGEVPRDFAAAVKLKGVGRKTASVVLGHAYGIAEGIAVDTHVLRLTSRLGLTKHDDPIRVEQDLMKLVPKERWVKTTDLIIFHGRRTCDARKPRCGECGIFDLCPWASKQAFALNGSKAGPRKMMPAGKVEANSLRRSDGVWGLSTAAKSAVRPPAKRR